jgi:hypothetical protein
LRYPYERFIIFLLSRKVDVNEVFEGIDLPEVGLLGLADRRERIRESAPPALLRYLLDPSPRLIFRDGILGWADDHGVLELWERQREFGRKIDVGLEGASNIFLNPQARTVLGTMLLSDASPDEISDVIKGQFSLEFNSSVLACFKRIFWDLEGMGRKEWERFLPELSADQRHVLAMGVKGLRPDDIRYAIGAETSSNPKDVLQDILTHAHHQFRQAMNTANPASAGAFKWADLATKVASAIGSARGGGRGEEEEIPGTAAAGMFSVTVESPKIVTLDDLEGEIAQNQTALERAIEAGAT